MILDFIIIVIFIAGFSIGYRKGIINSLFLILALVLGTIAALSISPIIIGLLESAFDAKHILIVISGFILTFLIVMLLIRVLGKFVDKIFKKLKLSKLNKLAGGLVSSFFFIICISLIFWFFDQARLIPEDIKDSSYSYEYVQRFPEAGKEGLKSITPIFQDFWEKSMDAIDASKQNKKGK